MNQELNNIRLKFNCPADWNEMPNTAGGRHCNSCNKTVYDFTDARPYEFLQILAENNNNVCGRFRAEQMAPIHLPVWKKWLSAALVLIGINVMNNQTYAQGKPVKAKQTVAKHKQIKFPPPIVVGDIIVDPYDTMPQFPEGEEAMKKYFDEHLDHSKAHMEGKVYVSFTINIDGKLDNLNIVRSLSPAADNEVIRMVKASPRWKPATLKGKPVAYERYVVPIKFN